MEEHPLQELMPKKGGANRNAEALLAISTPMPHLSGVVRGEGW